VNGGFATGAGKLATSPDRVSDTMEKIRERETHAEDLIQRAREKGIEL
jgi:hypothetical protein